MRLKMYLPLNLCYLQTVCASLILVLFLTLITPCTAQVAPMSAMQARQLLLRNLLPPDTNLSLVPTPSTSFDGHPSYVFTGNGGGDYRIDAVTAEKSIHFAGISGGQETPAVLPFSAEQLQQAAETYVRRHFPNYSAASFRMAVGPIDSQSDMNEYDVGFAAVPASGAEVPQHCSVIVEEDSGKIKSYEETAIPVTVSTTPGITQAQAVRLGQGWIAQNISADPWAGEFQTDLGGQSPISLEVAVDSLLNQALVYKISYRFVVLTIDAQSGDVLAKDEYIGSFSHPLTAPKRPANEREKCFEVQTVANDRALLYAAIAVQGQIYLRENYLKLGGVSASVTGKQLVLTAGEKRLRLSVAQKPSSYSLVAWKRKGVVYVPLAALRKLTNRFGQNSDLQLVVINNSRLPQHLR